MPLAGEYTWRETEKQLILTIPLKGTSPKSVDVFGARRRALARALLSHDALARAAAELILKVSFPPYLVNLDLFDAVDENRYGVFLASCYPHPLASA